MKDTLLTPTSKKTAFLHTVIDGLQFQAYCAFPRPFGQENQFKEKSPTVLVFHDWSGRGPFSCHKADALSELGYIGIAIDLYGEGKLGGSKEENSALMSPLSSNRGLLRERLLKVWDSVLSIPEVEAEKMAAVGFCFGGLCALDLARSGVSLKGVVSFHGLLQAPEGLKVNTIQSKVLVLHGHEDPMVSSEQVLRFQEEMTQAKVDWQFHTYSHTMHGFTHPDAHDEAFGAVFNLRSDQRSWLLMKSFLKELFEC